MSRRDRRASDARRRAASVSLAVCCLLPIPVVFATAGVWADAHLGELSLAQVLLALPLMALAISLLMFAGAALWLVFARFWVPREIAAGFFSIDGVGWFSAVSRWLFEGAYGK